MNSILLLGPSLSAVSGVSTHLNQLLGSTLNRDFRLVHFQVGSEGRNEGFIEKCVRLAWSPLALAGKISALRPAVVHLNTSIDQKAFWRDAVYLVVAKLLRRRVVYQIHGGELPESFFGTRGALNWFARHLLSLPDAIILLARAERTAYERFAQLRRLVVIPNAVDLNLSRMTAPKKFDPETLQLGYIGRIVESKGIAEAIEALRILRQRGHERVHFSIAGSGPAEALVRERVRAFDLEEWVSFVGPVFGEDKVRFWREMTIFVFPTHREGLPYAILESLASGTPMVTTAVGGIPDAVTDGVHGFFVEPGNAEAIADSIQRMGSDRAMLRRMSAACLQRAQAQYGVARLVQQLSEIYKAVQE